MKLFFQVIVCMFAVGMGKSWHYSYILLHNQRNIDEEQQKV